MYIIITIIIIIILTLQHISSFDKKATSVTSSSTRVRVLRTIRQFLLTGRNCFFLFVCLFLVFSSSHLLGWKLVIFWMNSWRLYVLRAEHDNTLKQSHFCVLQKYAGCSNSLLPCHVHFRPDWKRVWADQVKSLDFASQTSQICPPQSFMLKVFFFLICEYLLCDCRSLMMVW